MKLERFVGLSLLALAVVVLAGLALAGCNAASGNAPAAEDSSFENGPLSPDSGVLTLPPLSPVDLDGRPLRVVATTSIIGDVVGQVGREAVNLTTLIRPGQDPHSYQPAARDLTAVAEADVIFVNGWNLEEGLIDDLVAIAGDTPLVPVSAGVAPRMPGAGAHEHGDEEHDEPGGDDEGTHESADPHTWMSVPNVMVWAGNAGEVLSALDPGNAAGYQDNAATYQADLRELDAAVREQIGTIPAENRVMVTNHDALGYLAAEYGLEVAGTVIPATSSAAEPSAGELAALIAIMNREQVCTIFIESTASESLGQTVAAEVDACDEVKLRQLYTGALGPPDGEAGTYIDLMKSNLETIVTGLIK